MTSTNPLYAAKFHYHDGDHEYSETTFFRADSVRTEDEIRAYLENLSGLEPDLISWAEPFSAFPWSHDEPRAVQISMREIRSLDDLIIHEVP